MTDGTFKSFDSMPRTVIAVRFTDEFKDRIYNQLTGQHCSGTEDGKPIIKITTAHGEIAVVRLGDCIVEDCSLGTYYPVKNEAFHKQRSIINNERG